MLVLPLKVSTVLTCVHHCDVPRPLLRGSRRPDHAAAVTLLLETHTDDDQHDGQAGQAREHDPGYQSTAEKEKQWLFTDTVTAL